MLKIAYRILGKARKITYSSLTAKKYTEVILLLGIDTAELSKGQLLCHSSLCAMPQHACQEKGVLVQSPSLLALFQTQSPLDESGWPNRGYVMEFRKLPSGFYPGMQDSKRETP